MVRSTVHRSTRGFLFGAVGSISVLTVLLGMWFALDPSDPPTAATSAGAHPNILLIVLDTVRADRLSTYGYGRPTSPELDEFATEAIRFADFYSTSVWTVPTHASLFTGLYPVQHGATQEHRWLAPRFATLAERLRDHGYRTFGASANPNVGRAVNLDQGFQTFLDTWHPAWESDVQVRSESVADPHPNNRAFLAFLGTPPVDGPFFAFLNYVDAHVPLVPPSPHRERFLSPSVDVEHAIAIGRQRSHAHYMDEPHSAEDLRILSDLYDAEISHLSEAIGRLLDAFRRDPRFEDTLIAITSDHGEHLGEQGLLGHMFGLYNTTVRIPLLIRLPDGARGGEVSTSKGQLVDLFATLLHAAGIATTTTPTPRVDLLAGDGRRDGILSEYYYPDLELANFSPEELQASADRISPYRRRLRALERYGYRFIWSSDGRHELYNVLNDPGEEHDLLIGTEIPAVAGALQQELEATVEGLLEAGQLDPMTIAPAASTSPDPLDPQAREALRSLGYLR